MKSRFGNIRLSKDGCLYGAPRKRYTRKNPYPTSICRVAPDKREKAAIIKLRKHGYPVNMLSKFLGRSTSFIHRVIRTAIKRHTLHMVDMRKLPSQTRLSTSIKRWINLLKIWTGWKAWIKGDCDEPP